MCVMLMCVQEEEHQRLEEERRRRAEAQAAAVKAEEEERRREREAAKMQGEVEEAYQMLGSLDNALKAFTGRFGLEVGIHTIDNMHDTTRFEIPIFVFHLFFVSHYLYPFPYFLTLNQPPDT